MQIVDCRLAEPEALAEAEAIVESSTRYVPDPDAPLPSDDDPHKQPR